MMRVDLKQLSEAERIRYLAFAENVSSLSRRAQAMLAGANEVDDGKRWFVIRIAPHAEKDVDKSLAEAKIQRWSPVEKRVRRASHAKRKVVFEVPAMPGYAFVRVIPSDQSWAGLAAIKGVVAVLGGVLGPVPVDDTIMLKFQRKLDALVSDAEALEATYPVGCRVAIDDGPFASFVGSIYELLEHQRVSVLVEILGGFVPIELELAQITKAD